MADQVVDTVIRAAFDVARHSPASSEDILNTNLLQIHVVGLQQLAGRYMRVRDLLLQWLQQPINDDTVDQFLRTRLSQPSCAGDQICVVAAEESRRKLMLELCLLFVHTVLLSPATQDVATGGLPQKLLGKLQQLAVPLDACSRTRITNKRLGLHLPKVETECTPGLMIRGRTWHDQIQTFTELESKHRQDSLVRVVSSICHDLEERCESAEQPLREELEKRGRLQQEYDSLLKAYEELQGRINDRNLLCDSFESENGELKETLTAMRTETHLLSQQISGLESQLRDVGAQKIAEISRLEDQLSRDDLAYRAELAAKEEEIEDLTNENEEARQQFDCLQSNLDSMEQNLKLSTDDRAKLEEKTALLQQQLDAAQETSTKVEQARANVQNQLSALQEQHQKNEDALDSLKHEHQRLLEHSAQDMAAMRVSHAAEMELLRENTGAQERSHDEALERWEWQLKKATIEKDSLSQQVEQQQATIDKLRVEVRTRAVLTTTCRNLQLAGGANARGPFRQGRRPHTTADKPRRDQRSTSRRCSTNQEISTQERPSRPGSNNRNYRPDAGTTPK